MAFPHPSPTPWWGPWTREWRPLALLLGEALLARLDKVIALALVRFADLLPLDQVARSLGVDRQILYVWQQRGRLVVYRPGGKRNLLSHPWLFLGTRERPPLLPPSCHPPARVAREGERPPAASLSPGGFVK